MGGAAVEPQQIPLARVVWAGSKRRGAAASAPWYSTAEGGVGGEKPTIAWGVEAMQAISLRGGASSTLLPRRAGRLP